MTAAATFTNVGKNYPAGWLGRTKLVAVDDVSFAVPTGSVFGLFGPNRAGKTTLVKLLLGLTRPTSGSVQRLGQSIDAKQTLARVGYVHENQLFPRYLTASDLLKYYAALGMVPYDIIEARVDLLLKRVGLDDRRNESVSRFSKGMVQRLGLAQSLLNDPDLLILDEPTEGLDLFGRGLLRDVVAERKAAGKTVILVSHVLTEADALCDAAGVLVRGKLAYHGSLSDLKRDGSLEDALRNLYLGSQA